MKVISKFTIDNSVFIAQYANKQIDYRSNYWLQFYSYFVYLNCFSLPAFLFFWEYYLAGLAVFLLNIIFLIFLRDKINKESFKSFYSENFENSATREIEVQLSEEGLTCTSEDGRFFYFWKSVKEIVVTEDTIYIFTKSMAFPILKNSFEFGSQMQEFLIFAQSRVSKAISAIK